MTNLDKNSTGNEKTQGFYATYHRKNCSNCMKNMIGNRKNWKLENKKTVPKEIQSFPKSCWTQILITVRLWMY